MIEPVIAIAYLPYKFFHKDPLYFTGNLSKLPGSRDIHQENGILLILTLQPYFYLNILDNLNILWNQNLQGFSK